jgi:hypothetical protein
VESTRSSLTLGFGEDAVAYKLHVLVTSIAMLGADDAAGLAESGLHLEEHAFPGSAFLPVDLPAKQSDFR